MDAKDLIVNAQRFLDLLLRYVVAGGAAVLAYGTLQPTPFSFLRVGTEISPLLMLLAVAVIGPAIYSIHKAVLHPIVLALELTALKFLYKLQLSPRQMDIRMTDAMAKWKADGNEWVPYYDAWAAQIHFLYCSAWGIGFACVLASFVYSSVSNQKLALGLGTVLLLSAIISDARLNARQPEKTINGGWLKDG